MEILKQYTQAGGAWCTAALLTGAACVMGALFVMVRRANSHQKAKKKILSAQARREQNFQQAERAVLEYKKTVRGQAECKTKVNISKVQLVKSSK